MVNISEVTPNRIAWFEVASASRRSLWTVTVEMSRAASSGRGMTAMPLHASSRVMSAASAG
ncbi:hypothetical protein Z045_23315 [Rhodococcus pyridinivorans KG-16]|uniref:Uncharacterized protein n=1 Tax=Rhodococcus pyridinivorans KG-16 TaxID=1441730 RepID=A0A0V9UE70_9NOCA|nr:hypothetical protein Z045_23315 [Rhodococcus pyridinivorans KG-16]